MSAILTLADITLRIAGYGIYYTGSGVWWLMKRVVYGKQLTIEQKQELILRQQKDILNNLDTKATVADQQEIIQAISIQLEQQAELTNTLLSQNKNRENN